jgi:hypothetical protein
MVQITTAESACKKNYYNTACNIYRAVYDSLNMHIINAFKIVPPTNPPTIGWNSSMLLNNIFDLLVKTYG